MVTKDFASKALVRTSHLKDKPAEIAFEEHQCSIDEVSQVVEQLCVVLEDKISPVEHSILYACNMESFLNITFILTHILAPSGHKLNLNRDMQFLNNANSAGWSHCQQQWLLPSIKVAVNLVASAGMLNFGTETKDLVARKQAIYIA